MKTNFYTVIFLFSVIFASYAQVGIGTTNPNSSAILDVSSTTSGMLIPRMSTSERNGITSPAEGLLVYDTNENEFYYFRSGSWAALNDNSNNERDNYKLIKSESDLADELTAGSGTTYLLNTNTYYEINGTINLTAPIDLNNAYISGLDANEDVLINTTGNIFSGTSGGSIRNLTLIAPSNNIFDISAMASETLVFQNSIVANSASLGSLSGFGVVFINIVNIANNSTGITFTDINNLLLSNLGWFESNGGTFETYIGTFDLIEKISGFLKVPSGATGIDVSANPTVGSGNIISTPFSGLGTYVNPYTVGNYTNYNFNNSWNVDSPGIPLEADSATIGYFSMSDNTTATNLTTSNTPVKVAGATASNSLFRTSSTNNRITYEGSSSREFVVICSGTLEHTVNNARVYDFYVYKNGVQVSAISSERRFSRNDVGSYSMTGVLNLAPGDYIEIWVSINNVNSVPSCLIGNLSVVLK